ncbi:MAG: CBS domain-containing protein [Flavobacteriia bacterium]|nr:CBS domain-containing protein [Flavobacteriia bacterium]OIP47042.1 MAG: acetoin utilization protein acuB [Flavobacteriaceae bacterium CG2_30_31_66]PIV97773.1 MAG: acetoin utilization protein acuB [Flavobacteriaceae bacterium CG17_big_fil_post_rev_8_21_14_2_50_31_13]PIX12779.1 MAG: acetoin utilization protein acuB [Flavobacteriaceae bacterium CG_4_8_14_3_um_filter_31_8]PIY14510.1 MAG: acetoin utilization protein acuB [Flavobacteriaceae bacterium CG_4_10_14_3_um_filter_31_253]PIZ11884.1 MAG: 
MNITDYILKEIEPLRLNSSIKFAQELFKNHPITHFPVTENGKLLGSFAEYDIQNIDFKKEELVAYVHLLNSFFADEKATVLELFKIFADNDTNIIPVLNEEKNYIGYYDLRDVLDVFSTSPFMIEESETLIIKKPENDYSMCEVSQIVESNGGRLLGAYVSKKTNEFVQITLKIISDDLNEIMHTFRRYNYEIVSTHENDIYLEDLKNRSEYLQKYLEM